MKINDNDELKINVLILKRFKDLIAKNLNLND